MSDLQVIDIGPLAAGTAGRDAVARRIDEACRDTGFFYVVGHGVDHGLQERLERSAREFFAMADSDKAEVAMPRAGAAWRGWFPVGGELTSGEPDRKEGIYFGQELGREHPRVRAGIPLHGSNLFPASPAGLRSAVLEYIDAMTRLGHTLAGGLALALGLDHEWFDTNLTADPTILFRIFHYPPDGAGRGDDEDPSEWGVGEHTDYGLLTILRQDSTGGLQVHTRHGWWDAPPIADSFVCNLGDMLERMTGGLYRSTPHRVRNKAPNGRLSFPFFFDPGWDAEVLPVPLASGMEAREAGRPRWDGVDVHEFQGTYGEYLLGKVGKVFPSLGAEVIE